MPSRSAGEPARRTWPQRLLISFNIFVIMGALTAAAGLGYLQLKLGELQRVSLGHVLTSPDGDPGAPTNFLLVGTDNAAGLDADDPILTGRDDVGGLRSDTIMVLRVDPGSERASLLSFPRDLWVPIRSSDGESLGNDRINAAINVGGPEALIETIEGNFNIPINNYLQVDFLGFKELVEAVGGVPVYFDTPVRDRNSGLAVEDAGCVTLDRDQALAFARSRNYERFVDGDWEGDLSADLGRVSRQQDFIRRALKQAVASGVRNPAKLNELINVGLDNVTVDDQFTASDVFNLGRRFRSFNPDTLDMFSLPVIDDTVGGAAVLDLVEADAQPILDVFRGVVAGEVDPASTRVQVLNGSGVSGQAASASEQLSAVGFATVAPSDAGETLERSVVRYPADQLAAAQLVAGYIEGGADLEEVTTSGDGDVTLVTGTSFIGIAEQAAPGPDGSAEQTPEELAAEEGDPDEPGQSSSTTVVGEVPAEPPPDVSCG